MIAHLQDGRYGSTQILSEATARRMRDQLLTHDPRLDGTGYGFMRMTFNGEHIVQHGGDTLWFHCFLLLLPERKTGVFVAYNTDTTGSAKLEMFEALLDRYYPAAPEPPRIPLAGLHDWSRRYEGTYAGIRYSYTSVTKLGALLNTTRISTDGDMLVMTRPGLTSKRYVEIEPRLFREVDGQETLIFRDDDQGRITHLFSGNNPAVAMVKLPWYETPMFTLGLVATCAALCLSALIGWPVVAYVRRGKREPLTAGSRVATCWAWIVSLAILAWMALCIVGMGDANEIVFGVPPLVAQAIWCTPTVAALVAGMLICGLVAWKNRYWWFSGRLHYTCVALAGVAFIWFLNHWNLLRFGP